MCIVIQILIRGSIEQTTGLRPEELSWENKLSEQDKGSRVPVESRKQS